MNVKLTTKFFDELTAVEVDTFDPDEHDESRARFVALFEQAHTTKRHATIEVDETSAEYWLAQFGAFNHSDVWYANGLHGFLRSADRIRQEVTTAFPEVAKREGREQAERARRTAAWIHRHP